MDAMVGIDLGTTNSLIGAIVEGKITLFDDLVPSVVGADERGAVIVGRQAKNRRLIDPAGTVSSIKRKMGTDSRVRVGSRELSPTQISALILGALLDRAEAKLGVRPTRAVITVPAFFDDMQRQATRDAGEIAGLKVERLLNEPTAAALNYQSGGEARVLAYDLGGGTFDVSVLERDEGFLEVRASRGDTKLGGDDIDAAFADFVIKALGATGHAVKNDRRAFTRLLESVERAKISLSEKEEVKLFEPFLTDDVHVELVLRREDLEQVARPFIERTLKCIDDALRDAKLEARELDRILLVGGASKMPLVARIVAEHLGMPTQLDEQADRAVAMGASLLAGRLSGVSVNEVLVDITPHTLSVGCLEGGRGTFYDDDVDMLVASPVVQRDTVIPVERTRTYYTAVTDQPEVHIPVLQGESPLAAGNTTLGEVRVTGLPPSPAQSPVDVTFRVDLSGVVHIRATHGPSGRAAEVTIANSPYRLTAQKREAARAEVESMRAATPAGPSAAASQADLQLARAMILRAEKVLERADADAERARLREATDALVRALGDSDPSMSRLTEAVSDALLDLA